MAMAHCIGHASSPLLTKSVHSLSSSSPSSSYSPHLCLSTSFLPCKAHAPSLQRGEGRRGRSRPPARRNLGLTMAAAFEDLDQDTIVGILVAIAGVAVGIGIPVFYETQMKSSATRENDQPCFPCKGSGAQICRFCVGSGSIAVELGGGEKEVSQCINCEGAGSITCTTCQGSGVQPRYLDRREYKDDD